MHVNDDGTVAGSIDRAALEDVEPKTDEARAQLDALKAEAKAGEDANAALAAFRNPEEAESAEATTEVPEETVEAVEAEDPGEENLDQLRADAEAAGVQVDGRWGAQRLRDETAAAKGEA